jgi:hypothetical protein
MRMYTLEAAAYLLPVVHKHSSRERCKHFLQETISDPFMAAKPTFLCFL